MAVNAVVEVIAVPTVPLTVCDAGESAADALASNACVQNIKSNTFKGLRRFDRLNKSLNKARGFPRWESSERHSEVMYIFILPNIETSTCNIS